MAKTRGRKADPNAVTLGVSFGGVSFGDKTARLGVTISRGQMTAPQAEKNLCERRLKVRIRAAANSNNGDQESLPGMEGEDSEMEAIVDIKGYSAGGKSFGCGLTFLNDDRAKENLPAFAKREGQLVILENSELPENEQGGGPEEET